MGIFKDYKIHNTKSGINPWKWSFWVWTNTWFSFYKIKLLTFTCSLAVGALIQCSHVLTSVSSMAWEYSYTRCYLARAHPSVVKGAAPLCWMQLQETRKWAIKRHRDGKDKSFPDYVMGNGGLNTKQTENGVLSTTAFWLFAVNCYIPTADLKLMPF